MLEEDILRLEEAVEERQALKSMFKSAGWETYSNILQGQLDTRDQLDETMDLVSDPLALQKLIELRAEARMLELILRLPELLIEDLTEEIDEQRSHAAD